MNDHIKCKRCGGESFIVELHERHGYKTKCSTCGAFERWLGKDGNRRQNHRIPAKAEGVVCASCGITKEEAETLHMGFEADHIIPLEFGGEDTSDNIQPLCGPCHAEKTAKQVRTRGIRKTFNDAEAIGDILKRIMPKICGQDGGVK